MGSICSCLQAEDFQEHAYSNASIYSRCVCLRCLIQQLIHAYNSLFQSGGVQAVSPSVQETAPLASVGSSMCDTYRSPPRPLSYDDPRFSRLQPDGVVSRCHKSSGHLHEESQPLRTNTDIEVESESSTKKCIGYNYDAETKLRCHEFPLKQATKFTKGVTYYFPSSEDEDVCPTCLEEYIPENPRIIMQCSHHFHLGCIYEWMERSEACPVCGKKMVFSETT
ncbi:E3 ubiquitin-protein ligase At3g02290-like [Typha angustifolia]|uniref:E3 ubiquitin-protein ligase At3g02290-like n=1 Tax=Typha angustifolia TaxID=59011 RepID=UPI003C2BB4E7